MNKKYKLLPSQVEILKKQYNDSLENLVNLNVIKKEDFEDLKRATTNEINLGLDSSFMCSLLNASSSFKDAQAKLTNYEILEISGSDKIELGSNFEATINYGGEKETDSFILVEVRNTRDEFNLVSVDSPLGKAVLGKSIGDNFTYRVENRVFEGTINNIIKPKQKTL